MVTRSPGWPSDIPSGVNAPVHGYRTCAFLILIFIQFMSVGARPYVRHFNIFVLFVSFPLPFSCSASTLLMSYAPSGPEPAIGDGCIS
jgi:hypothetical protein